ncbi:MAG: hypothetical protein ACXVDF_25440, partial [Ktedonobacterales bacterium]
WLRTGWGQLALLSAIIIVVSLAATNSIPRAANMQIFVTRDVSRPSTVRLILKTVSLPPLGVSSQSCDGVAFQHGFPDQALYLGIGWYVDVPARPTGQSYHCTFKNAFVTRALDIPASNAGSDNGMSITAPAPHATLSRKTAVTFSIATTCEPGGMTPQMALIADAAGHSAIAREWGCGSQGGTGRFSPPQAAGFVAGPGKLAVYTERMVFPAASGWSSATNIIYYTAVSVPVVWS